MQMKLLGYLLVLLLGLILGSMAQPLFAKGIDPLKVLDKSLTDMLSFHCFLAKEVGDDPRYRKIRLAFEERLQEDLLRMVVLRLNRRWTTAELGRIEGIMSSARSKLTEFPLSRGVLAELTMGTAWNEPSKTADEVLLGVLGEPCFRPANDANFGDPSPSKPR
jgi:hypothetical protein